MFSTFNFLRSGTTGLVAQAYGRGDAVEEQAVLLRAVIVSLARVSLMALLAPLVSLAGAWFMGAEPRVLAAMDTYVRIRLLGAPFALMPTMPCSAMCWGAARAARPAPADRAQRRQHRAGDRPRPVPWLGRGRRGLGGGVAARRPAWSIGTVQSCAALSIASRPSLRRIVRSRSVLAMLTLNRDIMIRSFVLLAAFALFTRQGAQFGTLTLAANAVLMNFFLVGGYFLDGLPTPPSNWPAAPSAPAAAAPSTRRSA